MKIFISIFTFLLIISINSSDIYTPSSLKYYYDVLIKNTEYDTFPNIFLDPEDYISSFSDLIKLQQKISRRNKINTLFGVISDFQGSLENFTEEFAQIFYENDTKLFDNSMTIIYSVTKKEIWISTGNITKLKYNNTTINYLLSRINRKLKSNKLRRAFKKLLKSILYIKKTKKKAVKIKRDTTTSYLYYIAFLALILLFLFIIIRIYYCGKCFDCCYKKRELTVIEQDYIKNLEQFLNNIDKNIITQNEICTNNCIICLNSLNQNNISTIEQEISIVKSDDLNLSKNQLSMNNQDNSDMSKKTLKCGHSFHKKCINEWLKIDELCPLCKEHFEVQVDTAQLEQKIMNIQEVANPILNQWEFYYEENRLINGKQPRIYPSRKKNFNKKSNSHDKNNGVWHFGGN